MGRRSQRGEPISGWINVDKPKGITSAVCVNSVRRATNAAKLGHAGTLDPDASGILPIALGEATKTMPFIVGAQKHYSFTINWGALRDTDDAQGQILEYCDHRPTKKDIEEVLPSFIGEIEQVPPKYSAIKVNGRRAYSLARSGLDVDLKARKISIFSFKLLEMIDDNRSRFSVISGKGAYMRGLARDLAYSLGTLGYLSDLRRNSVGPFSESNAISLEKIEKLGHSAAASPILLPIETALDGIPALDLTVTEATKLRNGQAIPVFRHEDRAQMETVGDGGVVIAIESKTPVALVRVDGIQIRPVRVLNL